jgi:predicted enzyme related to lactoylglutathione lyase
MSPVIATVSLLSVEEPKERVTGVRGVFFRARDPEALVAWYREHLGVPVTDGYVIFPESRDTHWIPFAADTTYWPEDKQSMVNFTVRDLDALLAQLRAAGVSVDERVEDAEYGRFGWATDPEGNRIELWQPLGS